MSKLIFNAADVKRVVEHTLAAPKQGGIPDWSKVTDGRAASNPPKKPAVILVHDQGVYLMSNGEPRDTVKRKNPNGTDGEGAFVAYAKGCNPDKDKDDWYDNARDLVGGDDFGDHLEWAEAIKKMLDDGATEIVINFGTRQMSLAAKYPKGKGPQKVVVPWTPDSLVKHLQKSMSRQVVLFDPKTNAITNLKAQPTAVQIDAVKKHHAGKTIVNGLPTLELYKIVTAYLEAKQKGVKAA
jgi:hypothetical protein